MSKKSIENTKLLLLLDSLKNSNDPLIRALAKSRYQDLTHISNDIDELKIAIEELHIQRSELLLEHQSLIMAGTYNLSNSDNKEDTHLIGDFESSDSEE